MAYAIKYLFKFESSNGTTREIRVLQDGYTGGVIQRPLGRAPVLKKQQNGPVHGTSLEFYAECNVDREFIEFYTSDPKAYRVDLYAGATLLWQGYITPELYSEPDIAPPYDVQVVATDGVGELKLYGYAAQGAISLRALLAGLLSRTGLGTDIYLISSLKAGSRGAGALLDMTINLDYMAGRTCYEVLTYILDTLHATITWWKGAWILTRETNVTFTNGKVRYFNTAGNSALLNDSVQVLGKMYANPAWPVGQLSTVIDPAKNKIEVQAPWHVVTCLQNSDMGSDADWVKAKNARYETDGYVLPININTGTSETAVISQATSMAGLRVPMSLSVKATGATSEISAQVIGAVLGVLLTYKVGNVTYHLVKGDDGAPVWQQGDDIGTYIPLRTRIDFQQKLATWDSSRIEAEELAIENIPPFLQGTTFPAGTLTVYILGYCAKIYGAYLDVTLPKGYADILHIGNGARGEGNTVEIAIGRETADNAYYAAFLQGLLLDSGNLIASFSDANFTTGMDYLAFIARDYALSVALPRAKVTGTVFLEGSVQIPPLVFTKGGLDYWVETWGWNLYEDELEISARTLPSASLTVESETILESNGSTVSSAGGAGSTGSGSSMGGGGTNYWEIDDTLNTLLKPKSAYSYLGVKDGIFFSGATEADFEVQTINGQRVIHSRLPFYSDGFISAGGISDGGGSAGGNATLVAQTYGGTLSATGINPINFYSKEKVDQLIATAGTVQTVAGVSPVSGDIPVASLQSALGLGAAAYKAVGSVASGNTGLVTGGDVWTAIDNLPEPMVFKGSLGTGGTITSLPAASSANEGFTYKVITAGTYRGTAAKVGDTFISNGSSWILIPSGDEPEGTVTSVGLSMPTGFSVGSSPITSSGALAVTFASGYSLPTTAKQSNWDTAYGWGNHANAGYLLAATAASTYATITALNGVSSRVTTLEGRTNWDTYFGVDENGDIYVKKNGNTARNFYSWGAVSAGGLSSGGGSEGASLAAVWASLRGNSDDYANEKINAYHIPIGSGLSVVNGLIVANNAGTVTSVKVGTTTYNPTDGVVSLPAYPTVPSTYALSSITGADDLKAIEALTGTSGFLKKTAANTWALDTSTYLTGITSTMVTTALGYTPADNAALANYLPLTGGTLTSPSAARPLRLNSTKSNASGIVFAYNNTEFAGIVSYSDERYLRRTSGSWAEEYIIWDAGNSNLSTVSWVADTMTANSFKLASGTPTLTWDSNANAWHLSGNFYADGFISAGGVSSGGGASGVDLTAVWNNLIANTGEGLNKKIHTAHLPTVTVTGTNISGTATYSGTGGNASTLTLNLTAVDTKYTNGTGISLSGTTFSLDVAGAKTALGLGSNAYTSTAYLPLAGGAMNATAVISRTGQSVSWYQGRLYPIIKTTSYTGYNAILSMKTTNGSWDLGVYNSDTAYLTYITDENYSAGNNAVTYQLTFPKASGTVALTSQIPTNNNQLTNGAGYLTATTAASTYVKFDPGASEQTIKSSISTFVKGVINLWRSSGDHYTFLGFSNGTTETYLGGIGFKSQSDHNLYRKDGSNYYKILDENNYTSYVNTANFPGLNGNQTITLSGDVSGSGTTSISVSIGSGKVTNAMLAGSIANGKLANSSITINGSSTSLGGSFNTASITAGTAGQSTESSGVSFSVPYITMNAYGIVTGYGTHTHTISAQNLYDTIGSTKYAAYNANGYLPLNGGTMSNTNVVTNLNADRLDGYNETAFFRGRGRFPSNTDVSTFSGNQGSYFLNPDGTITNLPFNGMQTGFHTFVTTQNYGDLQLISRPNELAYRCRWSTWQGWHNIWHNGNSGTSSTAWNCSTLTASSNITASGAITAGAASDARLKTNISTLSDSDAKALIMALRPVTFTWNDKATELYDQYKGDDLGFVAQEVEGVLPVAIGTIFEKYKRLDQTKFIAPLVAVAKDHETRIEKLEKEVKARDAKIMELENEVKRLRIN